MIYAPDADPDPLRWPVLLARSIVPTVADAVAEAFALWEIRYGVA